MQEIKADYCPSYVITRHDDTSDQVTNLMGVVQALISIFAEEDDKIRQVGFSVSCDVWQLPEMIEVFEI